MMLRLSVVVLLGLLFSGTAEEIPQPSQEALGLLASLQQASGTAGEGSRNELREMATLYDLMQLAALQQQHQQREDRERDEAEELPVALPLVAKDRLFYPPLQDKEDYLKDKRGSYMSLCHFKICNMGRKRSSYWNPWIQN